MATLDGDSLMRAVLTGDRIPALSPICTVCRHRRGFRRCDAFPEEIPLAIWLGENDHRQPVAGDHGIRFEPLTEERVADLRVPLTRRSWTRSALTSSNPAPFVPVLTRRYTPRRDGAPRDDDPVEENHRRPPDLLAA
jgi:hypothetical protein